MGLFFMVLTGNFFFQFVVYRAVGGVFWPVTGGAVLGVFLPLLGMTRIQGLDLRRDFFLDLPPPRVLGAAALLAVASLAPTSMLAEFSLRLSPADPEVVGFMNDHLPTTAGAMVLAYFAVVVAGPLAEEIIFRGLLHRLASGVWGPVAATVVSSLIFAILHGEAWILFGLMGVGAMLAFVFEATGSVTACWTAHAVHNAISLFFMIRQGPRPLEPSTLTLADWALALGSLVALVFIARYLWAEGWNHQGTLDQE
jgi:membrane protease YdiL (CAAX protease family)